MMPKKKGAGRKTKDAERLKCRNRRRDVTRKADENRVGRSERRAERRTQVNGKMPIRLVRWVKLTQLNCTTDRSMQPDK